MQRRLDESERKLKAQRRFKLKHASGKFVHPQGGMANPDNETRLVLHSASESGQGVAAVTFTKVDVGDGCFKLQHASGKFVHPQGGMANPDNETRLVLHSASKGKVEKAVIFSEIEL